MCSDRALAPASDFAIRAHGLGKSFAMYERPLDRLLQLLRLPLRPPARQFHALRDVDFTVERGEVIGIVGRNGAGKSTLLQLICGTLQPTHGNIAVRGRIAALLELGAGFNPDFTGRENVYLNGTILGLSSGEIEARLDGIIAFADIGEFIDQPVKTYSSGMFVRLAFAVAVSVDPQILVIDEALSVGDGAFARKSFDRIMQLKDAGKTILFCSHSMYQVEALCSRALWIEKGQLRAIGQAADVVREYSAFLDSRANPPGERGMGLPVVADGADGLGSKPRLESVRLLINGNESEGLRAVSRVDELCFEIAFAGGASMPPPSVALCIRDSDGRLISSVGTVNDALVLGRDEASGRGKLSLSFPAIPLLHGDYTVDVYLLCDRALLEFDHVFDVCRFQVCQEDLLQGLVALPHHWRQ